MLADCEYPLNDLSREDLSYACAFVAFADDEIDLVEERASTALASADPNVRVRARNLVSFVYARRGDFERHAEMLRISFAERTTDVYARANTLYQLSILARETNLQVDKDELAAAVADLRWSSHISTWRFLTIQGLAWHYALNGSYAQAYRFAQDAIDGAPSQAWAVGARADYAQFAIAAGEQTSAGVHLEWAIEAVKRVDWKACKGEERICLLDLAVLQSHRDPKCAKRLLELYDSLGAFSPTLAFARDPRSMALRLFAGAMQLGVLREQAISELRDAHRIFVKVNYQWRAAAAASALADVTRDARWTQVARMHLELFPSSWLSRTILGADMELDGRYDVLSPQQQRVVKLVIKGLSDRQIAEHLGVAHKTARNHVHAVLQRLQLHSRRTLLTEHSKRAG